MMALSNLNNSSCLQLNNLNNVNPNISISSISKLMNNTTPEGRPCIKNSIILFKNNTMEGGEINRKSTMIFEKNNKQYSINLNNEDGKFFSRKNINENIKRIRMNFANAVEENSEEEGNNELNDKGKINIEKTSRAKVNIEKVSKFESKNKCSSNSISHTSNNNNLGVNLQLSSNIDLTKNISINKVLNDSNTYINQPQDNTSTTVTNIFPFQLCIICEEHTKRINLLKLTNCKHSLCLRCSKNYYEEKIEEGEILLKCPLFKCRAEVDKDEIIKKVVSEKHLNCLIKKLEMENTNNKGEFNNYNNNDSENKNNITQQHQSVIDTMKHKIRGLSNRHVLEVSNNEGSYLLFNILKDHFCKKCYEPALYGKMKGKIVKCLNCMQIFCKFCFKPMTSDHFDYDGTNNDQASGLTSSITPSSANYCKVYFRKKEHLKNNMEDNIYQNSLKKNKLSSKFIADVLIIIISIFLLLSYIYVKLINLSDKCFDCKSACRKIRLIYYLKSGVKFLVKIICFILVLMIGIVVTPYFPLINILIS